MERIVQCLDELEDLLEAAVLRYQALPRPWFALTLLAAAALAAAVLGDGTPWGLNAP